MEGVKTAPIGLVLWNCNIIKWDEPSFYEDGYYDNNIRWCNISGFVQVVCLTIIGSSHTVILQLYAHTCNYYVLICMYVCVYMYVQECTHACAVEIEGVLERHNII